MVEPIITFEPSQFAWSGCQHYNGNDKTSVVSKSYTNQTIINERNESCTKVIISNILENL